MEVLTSISQKIPFQIIAVLVCSPCNPLSAQVLKVAEMCYLLKYVDKKEKPGKTSNPWSIRQALIYQKSRLDTGSNEYIFVRLPELLGDMFRSLLSKSRAQTSTTTSPNWTEVQSLCFRSVIGNWRSYINWIDQEVSVIVSISNIVLFQSLDF